LTIRRSFLLLTIAVVVGAVMSLSGTALAVPDSSNPSCFGAFARSQPGTPGPGDAVSEGATGLAGTGDAESGTDEVATDIGSVQQVRPCPSDYPFDQ
jgi:hypothetical protein